MVDRRQTAHNVRQLTGGELATSTSAVTELGQPAVVHHVVTPFPRRVHRPP